MNIGEVQVGCIYRFLGKAKVKVIEKDPPSDANPKGMVKIEFLEAHDAGDNSHEIGDIDSFNPSWIERV